MGKEEIAIFWLLKQPILNTVQPMDHLLTRSIPAYRRQCDRMTKHIHVTFLPQKSCWPTKHSKFWPVAMDFGANKNRYDCFSKMAKDIKTTDDITHRGKRQPDVPVQKTGRGIGVMLNKEIVFFDQLRFGWVVDKSIIERLHTRNSESDTVITPKTLDDLLRKP